MSPTKIEWTVNPDGSRGETWNPVTGCSKVSSGCDHCYAEAITNRFGGPGAFDKIVLHPERLDKPLHWRKPRMVFVNSMSDLFHPQVSREFLLAMWAVMEAAPRHTFQCLTKRPARMRLLLGDCERTRPAAPDQPTHERRPILSWPGYYADTEGVIWTDKRGQLRPLAPNETSETGHAHVALHHDGQRAQKKVHRLVLMTFGRLPEPGEETCHRDGDPRNNRISNLYWGTRVANAADRSAHGTGFERRKLTPVQVAEVRVASLRGESQRSIGGRFGISHTQVGRIVSGESHGFKVLPNVWLGVSAENQETADKRIPVLLDTPAAVRFVSCEPLLGPIDLARHLDLYEYEGDDGTAAIYRPRLGWAIVGGESGPKARPMHPDWATSLRDQCVTVGVPFFAKQGSGPRSGQQYNLPDDVWAHKEMPVHARERGQT